MISFVCPRCKSAPEKISDHELRCSQDKLTFYKVDGIWRFLLPEHESHYARFIADYEAIRRFEGRGSQDESYYRTLPYHSSSDWRIRAVSFNAFIKQVVIPFEKNKRPLQILDLGAGNGWLSNQLASRGYDVAAVDLTINDFDGLGCHRFYNSTFLPMQAEFDYLPFADKSVDIVIFNASLHYSVNYEQTLSETQRVLNVDGKLIVLDSPVYHDANSGRNMVREREEQFTKRYGFTSNSLQSENYLTYQRMDELAAKLGIKWRHIRPFYGFRWALRPWLARLRGNREPAEFGLWVGSH
jgi:ubiquinone/menaquinone biosynthesis C-methylase UbiE